MMPSSRERHHQKYRCSSQTSACASLWKDRTGVEKMPIASALRPSAEQGSFACASADKTCPTCSSAAVWEVLLRCRTTAYCTKLHTTTTHNLWNFFRASKATTGYVAFTVETAQTRCPAGLVCSGVTATWRKGGRTRMAGAPRHACWRGTWRGNPRQYVRFLARARPHYVSPSLSLSGVFEASSNREMAFGVTAGVRKRASAASWRAHPVADCRSHHMSPS